MTKNAKRLSVPRWLPTMFAAVNTWIAVGAIASPLPVEQIVTAAAQERVALANGPATKRILFHPRPRHEVLAANSVSQALPIFTRTFNWQGRHYITWLVGTDPAGVEQTTTITTLIVPLRMDFGNGVVRDAGHDLVDGQTVVDDVIHSPLFNTASYSSGPTAIGNLQYADAYQRAEFWTELKNKPGRHVLLQPVVAASHTIVVPPGKVVFSDPSLIEINRDWYDRQLQAIIPQLGSQPNQLIIFLCGHDIVAGGGGYHDVLGNAPFQIDQPIKPPAQTYINSGSFSAAIGGPHASLVLSHEVIEWLNDPYVNNDAPLWEFFDSPADYSDLLEVCDPFEGFSNNTYPVVVNGVTYYIFEAAFLDYFTRAPVSRSVNGWYAFHNLFSTFSMSAATDANQFAETDVDVLGAAGTFPIGINNHGDIVGFFRYSAHVYHGFMKVGGVFTNVDMPGAFDTYFTGINDAGQASGFFDDSIGTHGFTWQAGQFTVADYSPTADTSLDGINLQGQVAGSETPRDGSPSFGLILSHGQFQLLSPLPFGFDFAASGINDQGDVVGTYDDQIMGASFGFLRKANKYSHLDFPAATATTPTGINSNGDVVGYLFDLYGFLTAFYKQGDVWLHIQYGGALTYLQGMNNQGAAVGSYYDANSGIYHGLVITPRRH